MRSLLLFSFLAFYFVNYSQIIDFPDANFKYALVNIKCVDTNGDNIGDADADLNDDGEIDMEEASKVKTLGLSGYLIKNIEGVNSFINLEKLTLSLYELISLNINDLPKLQLIYLIGDSKLNKIALNNLPSLRTLSLRGKFEKLDIADFPNLVELSVVDNYSLKKINLTNIEKLETLDLISCGFDSISIQDFPSLNRISLDRNYFLSQLSLRNLPSLYSLDLNYTGIPYLHLSDLPLANLSIESCGNKEVKLENMPNLKFLSCSGNSLEMLYLYTASKLYRGEIFGCQMLKYICCSENNLDIFENIIQKYNMNNINLNSYCSFDPFGDYGSLKGRFGFSLTNDSCEIFTNYLPIKFDIYTQIDSSKYIYANYNKFDISLAVGEYTMIPSTINHEFYFSPSSISVVINKDTTITQDFCITPKGIFRQTNITVIPLTPPARPGFEAKYKIVWENAGNQIENGTLNFTYDETLLDYISATQTADQVADGIIKWNFTNLLPFEKREITVTLKVNRPTDTPAVNAGDKLYLTASILDNIFTLENTVVGSYDPNDKTCLQGDRVKPDMIGKYVDYLIRFENTGNYAAENVVVKDIIDTKRFDVSTLQITDASHEVYARIEGNKVEFIFENIQLPFDDANNDGYIAFKIKTLPTLVLGDSLKNLADIYFDYNFPIRTNEAQTTIALPVFTKDITTEVNIYPNPVKDNLYFESDENWTKADIYDISGRIIRSISLVGDSMDVNGLGSGTYILRLRNGERVGLVKFVKL